MCNVLRDLLTDAQHWLPTIQRPIANSDICTGSISQLFVPDVAIVGHYALVVLQGMLNTLQLERVDLQYLYKLEASV